ncbi:MAG: hypothetical protein ABWY06_23060 [Pseudomonas sp.]|uniref:hypothetical protein n=1 Tax=Pseudomonas sp. TaxID=306 RepID=UPI00339569F3
MPNLFRKNALASACAVLATSAGLLASVPAQAVSLSTTGEGQVLIFPYYTVRGGNDTSVVVINGSAQGKVVSVRMRESKNGRPGIDFKVYLAPHDSWTGTLTATAKGARLVSADKTCTVPKIPAKGVDLTKIFQFPDDGAGVSEERNREGYLEVIELGVVTNAAVLADITPVGAAAPACTPVLHGDMSAQAGDRALAPPSGGLSGSATLANVSRGTELGYAPVVLEGFSEMNLWSVHNDADLRMANPAISLVLDKQRPIISHWVQGEDAVSAVLMSQSLRNEFDLDPGTGKGTDWVVNMPTKHYYVQSAANPLPTQAPFTTAFNAKGACEYQYPDDGLFWNRDGETDYQIPTPGRPLPPALCWESSVLTFNGSNVLASANRYDLETPYSQGVPFSNGWTEILFNAPGQQLVSLEGHVYNGLPVTGFRVQDLGKGRLSSYGGTFEHSYVRAIETTTP